MKSAEPNPRRNSPGKRRASKGRRGRLLTRQEQDRFVELLAKGWGRTLVCRKMGFSYQSFLRTVEEVAAFAEAVEEARHGVDEAVEMALYKAALEGKVTAQKFWLQRRQPEDAAPEARRADVPDEEDLSQLSDAELIERARAVGIDLPPAIARRLAKTYRLGRSELVPSAPGD